eukprot:TRINITY_DN11935_c0_g1_i1.p1 TRINITY_DN11935_c0_g1~~TRINITY_DN11935_c0_g1_i1.p1  ORF type:complete len:319 (+),score=79.83 TRINITY_DN11935_c0_g1_i1:104-1060(+)
MDSDPNNCSSRAASNQQSTPSMSNDDAQSSIHQLAPNKRPAPYDIDHLHSDKREKIKEEDPLIRLSSEMSSSTGGESSVASFPSFDSEVSTMAGSIDSQPSSETTTKDYDVILKELTERHKTGKPKVQYAQAGTNWKATVKVMGKTAESVSSKKKDAKKDACQKILSLISAGEGNLNKGTEVVLRELTQKSKSSYSVQFIELGIRSWKATVKALNKTMDGIGANKKEAERAAAQKILVSNIGSIDPPAESKRADVLLRESADKSGKKEFQYRFSSTAVLGGWKVQVSAMGKTEGAISTRKKEAEIIAAERICKSLGLM